MLTDISLAMAFAAGLVSFLSPCVLPLVPGYVSFISGVSVADLQQADHRPRFFSRAHRKVVINALIFILGFSAVFIALGASATWLGSMLSQRLTLFSRLAGLVIIFFGLVKMGLLRPLALMRQIQLPVTVQGGGLAAFVLGAAFAFGWTPCIGPVLGAILTFAGTLDQVNQGIAMLLVYSLGLGVPFLATALLIQQFFKFFNRIKRYMGLIEKVSGAVLVVMGVLIMTNALTVITGYLPFLQRFSL